MIKLLKQKSRCLTRELRIEDFRSKCVGLKKDLTSMRLYHAWGKTDTIRDLLKN